MSELPASLQSWFARGQRTQVLDRSLFYIDVGPTRAPAEGAPVLLLVHGFPTSSHDFHRVIDRLALDHRVIVHDHLGFGLSDKPVNYSYSLLEQAEYALALWTGLGVRSARVLAHDYGTSVVTEILARRQRGFSDLEVERLVLCNGSMHIELASLSASQRLLEGPKGLARAFVKFSNKAFFCARIRGTLGPSSHLDDGDLEAMWAGVERDGGRQRLIDLSSYLEERRRFWHRWIGALRRCELPTLVLWGRRDPIAVAAIAEQLHTEMVGSELCWLDSLGHFPMLEDPDAWVEPVLGFLA